MGRRLIAVVALLLGAYLGARFAAAQDPGLPGGGPWYQRMFNASVPLLPKGGTNWTGNGLMSCANGATTTDCSVPAGTATNNLWYWNGSAWAQLALSSDFAVSGGTLQLGADIPHTGPYDTGTNFDPTNGVTSVPVAPFNFGNATSFTLPTAVSFGGLSYTLPSSRTDSQCLKTGSGGTQGTLTWGSCGGGGLSDPATIDTDASGTLYGTSQAGGNLILDANSGDTAGEIQTESLVHLWPSLGTPATGTTTRLLLFDDTITKSNASNPWALITLSPTLTWSTVSGTYTAISHAGTMTATVAPSSLYQFSIFSNNMASHSATNAVKPFLFDSYCDYSGFSMDANAGTETVRGAVSFLSGKSFVANGGNYTLNGNAVGGGSANEHPNDIGLEYWPSFAAVGTSTLTYSSSAAAIYMRTPTATKDAGATLTLSGRLAGMYIEDLGSQTSAGAGSSVLFSNLSSLYSMGTTVTLINAGPAYIGALVDPAGAAYKLGVGGHLYLDNNTNTASELRFREPDGASHTETSYAAIKAPALSASYTLTLPTGAGAANQFLQTNGSGGVLTWAHPAETKCLTIDQPVDADDVLWFKNQSGATITMTAGNCIVAAATSEAIALNDCDANGANCVALDTATCGTTNTAYTALANDTVADGHWVRANAATPTGTVGHVTVCVTYTGAS